jgi:hypothetical protein
VAHTCSPLAKSIHLVTESQHSQQSTRSALRELHPVKTSNAANPASNFLIFFIQIPPEVLFMQERPNIPDMLHKERDPCDSQRLEKLEKKVRTLYTLFFGFLLGHFLGLLLFP